MSNVIEGTATEASTETAEYAFVVVKQADGRIAIGNLENSDAAREPTIDDIYSAISVIQRDIQVQQVVGAVVGILAQASGAPQQTKSGLVVPEPTSKFKKVTRV